MYAQPQPKVEIDGVKWTLTSRTPGILAHSKVVTAADGKKYQIWRGPKNRHLAHPIDDKSATNETYGDWRDQAIQKQHEWHNTERGDANFVFNGYTAKFKDDGLYIYRGGDLVKVKKGNYLPVTNKSILSAKTMISHLPKSVAEGASGYIPKNKREAKDPRWSNALTVDVHPDTPTKNMKALKLV
jgi:hypothetical protein